MNERRPPGSGGEVALIALGGSAIAAGFATWLGAKLAVLLSGGSVRGGLDTWLRVMVRLIRGVRPADAWGPDATNLPSTALYWAAASVAYLGVVGAAVGLVVVWRRLDGGGEKLQRRFGQPSEAREARPADVAPLRIDGIDAPIGRMLLGRMVSNRRVVLATEDRNRHPLKRKHARRQGNRGSVALIGPTGSGKTALVASAVAMWKGPVIVVSVKRDLFDVTVAARRAVGEIAVFDPGASTNLPTARWSPFRDITTASGAMRTGRALAQAIPRSGVTNAEYWAKHGEKLMGAFLCVAGLSRMLTDEDGEPFKPVSIKQLASWVTAMTTATDPTMNAIIQRGLKEPMRVEVQLMALHAATAFTGVQKEELKIRSSVYATAVLGLDPWLEPAVAHSASESDRPFYWSDEHLGFVPRSIDLEWLAAGEEGKGNTLYLTASQSEFERLSPVLGGLLADIKDTVHQWDIAGRRLDKPLLFVIDEAGHLELRWLATEVSTIAALGAFFVTCWQNLAQMEYRHEGLSDAVLSGHRTKCFFSGIDDLTTIRYLTSILGHRHVERWTASRDIASVFSGGQQGRRSMSETTSREEFIGPNTVREMYPGEAILLHGTLPPIHLNAVRWWEEKTLRRTVPLDEAGYPKAPTDVSTCPLTDVAADDKLPIVDKEYLTNALQELPRPKVARTAEVDKTDASRPSPDPPPKRADVLRAGRRCDRCGSSERVKDIVASGTRRSVALCESCAPADAADGLDPRADNGDVRG